MMRPIVLSLLLTCLPLGVCFAQTELPSIGMQSVNNSAVMSSGSAYTSATYEVGASGVRASVPTNGPRKVLPPPTTGGTTNQPEITTPLADACLPLMLLAVAYAVCMSLRRRKRIST